MSTDNTDASKHDQARELTEEALGKLVHGDEAAADDLIEKAKAIDETAVVEVVDDLNEDAADRGEISPGTR